MTTWRPLLGFPTYEVSDEGLVRSVRPRADGLPAVPRTVCGSIGGNQQSKRAYVKLYDAAGNRRTLALGPLVLRAFGIEPPNTFPHEVAYRDGNSQNNALENLCWKPKKKFVCRHTRRDAA